MSAGVMVLVLFAALLHASWNALVKSSPDKLLDIVLVAGAAALFALIALAAMPFPHVPAVASWPFIAASAVIHIVYFLLIGAAYRSGDMSHAYPLMRGTPPLLVALASGPLIGERLGAGEWCGVLCICGGILGLLLAGSAGGGNHAVDSNHARHTIHDARNHAAQAHRRIDGRTAHHATATRYALLNAVAIAGYTLVDGTGVRVSGAPAAYTIWVFLLTAPPLLVWVTARRRTQFVRQLRDRWHLALVGGACTLGAYMLVLWAMTQAPIAMVAALRESAILFATAISVWVLKERTGRSRPVAAALILLGVFVLKLA